MTYGVSMNDLYRRAAIYVDETEEPKGEARF
jgi:hypothetical protein